MDALTRSQKMDLILTHFKNQDKKGEFWIDNEIHLFLPSIGLTYNETDDYRYNKILESFKNDGLIDKKEGGIKITDKGRTQNSFEKMAIRDLKLNILNEVKDTFHSGIQESINDLIKEKCPKMSTADLGRMLQGLMQAQYIWDNGHGFRHLFQGSRNIEEFIEAGGDIKLKLLKNGFDYLESLTKQPEVKGHVFNINGSGNNIVNESANVKIKTLNNDDVAKLIPVLIELIKDMRNTDMDLLLAAVKDLNEEREIETTTYEKILAIAANISSVITPFLTQN